MNQRTDLDHGSPVFWSAPFGAVGNLPTGWSAVGTHVLRWCRRSPSAQRHDGAARFAAYVAIGNPNARRVDDDRDAEPVDVHPQRPEVPPPAAEADVGEPVGSGRVPTEHADDGLDGHGDSVAPVGPDGEWAEGLVGAAFRVWRNKDLDCWVADVVTRDRVRVCVALRRLVGKHALVWREDVAGFVPAGGESG